MPRQVNLGRGSSASTVGAITVQAENISKAAPWAIYGVVLFVFMWLLPQDGAGGLRRVAQRPRRRKAS